MLLMPIKGVLKQSLGAADSSIGAFIFLVDPADADQVACHAWQHCCCMSGACNVVFDPCMPKLQVNMHSSHCIKPEGTVAAGVGYEQQRHHSDQAW